MTAITICSTRSYAYALIAQARKIQACIEREPAGVVILMGDDSDEIRQAQAFYESILPEKWKIELITGRYEDGHKNYKNAAQLIIAQMRSRAFDRARQLNADLCWSLDSDVLPPPNALRCMKQMLEFDDGYYQVSTCPYPSQGGGDFLGGRGTPENPISPDFYDDERVIPDDLKIRLDAHRKRLEELNGRPDKEWMDDLQQLSEETKKCPPIGDVFFCNSRTRIDASKLNKALASVLPEKSELPKKILAALEENGKSSRMGFRRRGWMSAAYPALGQGAILPSDWCGFGCTLMGKRALSLAQFDGYDGAGTEDLYVVWKRWYPAGLRINVIPHCPCDHVIRDPNSKKDKKKYILCRAFHEHRDPECVGHLRIEPRPWYQQAEGEVFDEANNGQITHAE